jgi:hypothetical protein
MMFEPVVVVVDHYLVPSTRMSNTPEYERKRKANIAKNLQKLHDARLHCPEMARLLHRDHKEQTCAVQTALGKEDPDYCPTDDRGDSSEDGGLPEGTTAPQRTVRKRHRAPNQHRPIITAGDTVGEDYMQVAPRCGTRTCIACME